MDTKKKSGIGMLGKIVLCAMIPVLVMLLFAGLSLDSVGTISGERTANHSLQAICKLYNAYMATQLDNTDDFPKMLAELKEETHVDMTVVSDGVVAVSSIEEIIGQPMSQKILEQAQKGGGFFVDDLDINGNTYYAYAENLGQQGENQIILVAAFERDYIRSFYSKRLMLNTFFLILIALAAAVAVIVIVKRITTSLSAMVGNLDKVASGELTIDTNHSMLSRADEVGNIARSIQSLVREMAGTVVNINSTTDSLNDFSGKFKENFDSINSSIENINIAVDEIAESATAQASETQRVAGQMNHMGEAISATTVNVEELKASANGMKQANDEMSAALQELTDISERTKISIDEVTRQTNDTNNSANEIRKVVDIISDIASQTNLLSLNASIEAARAGEQGKGFAVVADEVRNLAEQSAASARHISQIVEELIVKSNTSVETMNSVMEEIETQDEKISDTRGIFERLDGEIESVSGAVSNIGDQMSALDRVKLDVVSGIEHLSAIAEENAASTEETSATMTELSNVIVDCNSATGQLVDLADTLKDNVNHFKLDR